MRSRLLILSVCLGIVVVLAGSATAPRGPAFQWPEGKRAAISLTFDDARLSQIDVGIPVLDRLGVKGTFYVNPDGVKERLEGWKRAVKNGHEVGNHTVNHPCTGNYDFAKDHALENMTLADIKKEIVDANRILGDLLGIKPESFAYPCCQMFVGRGRNLKSYVPMVAEMFLTARMGGDDAGNDPLFCDLSQLMAGGSDDVTFEKLKPMIDQSIAEGRWLILCGHEVGEAGFQITSTATLEAICRYANDPGNGLWIDTVSRIGRYVNDHRKIRP